MTENVMFNYYYKRVKTNKGDTMGNKSKEKIW